MLQPPLGPAPCLRVLSWETVDYRLLVVDLQASPGSQVQQPWLSGRFPLELLQLHITVGVVALLDSKLGRTVRLRCGICNAPMQTGWLRKVALENCVADCMRRL